MKLSIKALVLVIIPLILLSCSQDEILEVAYLKGQKSDRSSKLYKRSEGVLNGNVKIIQEVFYGKNNNVDSVIRNNVGHAIETFKVEYRGNKLSRIKYFLDYGISSNNNISYNYIVNSSIGHIKLEDPNWIFEIYHSGVYIDSTKSINPSDINSIAHNQFFNRNENDQLVSNGWYSYPDDYSAYTYSNFDSGKNPGPLNTVIEIPNNESILYIILGLKLSKDNPLTIELPYGESHNMTLNYDEEGYVTQGIWNFDDSFVESHFYIEQ
ncbi:hypothetical protein [Salinimicrobium flavum]|uniref:Lipoprotein n=1 Tax=Salinimicrobium flavum TaxID=1737065 RepID=A0ABW5IZU7_9FLAO